jgi:Cu2+-exporting ATPase
VSPPSTDANAAGACAHCAAPTPEGGRFCCAGCEAVFAALNDDGLGRRYYQLQQRDPEALRGVQAQPRTGIDYGWLDSEHYRRGLQHGQREPTAAYATACWSLDGMTCAACTWLVEEVATQHDGVLDARADLLRRELTLRFAADAQLADVAAALGRFGYGVGLQRGRDALATERRRQLTDLAIAGAAVLNMMLLTIPYYLGLDRGGLAQLFGAIAWLLATIVLAGPGRGFLTRALAAVRSRRLSLDVPLAIGLVSAWAVSTGALLLGRYEHVYLDTLAMLVFALLVGRFLQSRATERAFAQVAQLTSVMPQPVDVWRHGGWQRAQLVSVQPGERVRLGAGRALPFDAEVVDAATVDLAVITGEAAPRQLGAGAAVPSGAVNIHDAAVFVALGPADASAPDALPTPEPGALVTAISRWFTPAVLLAAAVAFAVQSSLDEAGGLSALAAGGQAALVVLVVACPCALGLAVPLVHALTMGRASRDGVLVRDPVAIERLGELHAARRGGRQPTFVFDKTGTLTMGAPEVAAASWSPTALGTCGTTQARIRRALAAIEAQSQHPIARAITTWAIDGDASLAGWQREPPPVPRDTVTHLAGRGIRGVWDGLEVHAGSPRHPPVGAADGGHGDPPRRDEQRGDNLDPDAAVSPVHVWVRAVAQPDAPWRQVLRLGLRDQLRADAASTVHALREQHGARVVLLSGDHERAVLDVAARLGIDEAHAEALPADKSALIERLRAHGPVVMVGDGLNDLDALQAADVSFAPDTAAPRAVAAAHVILHGRGIAGVTALLERSLRARRVVRAALAAGLAYNGLGVAFSIFGAITPLFAALLMPASSITVVSLSLYAVRR